MGLRRGPEFSAISALPHLKWRQWPLVSAINADQKPMRCLHCGKELALFKRLTRGEFCSDEHRQAYQREYSQMALSRLLQAKPPVEKEQPEDSQASDDGRLKNDPRQLGDRSGRLLTGSMLGLDRPALPPAPERPSRAGAQKRLPAPEGGTRPPAGAQTNKAGLNSAPSYPDPADSSSYESGADMSLAHDLVGNRGKDGNGGLRGASNNEPELSIFRDPLEGRAHEKRGPEKNDPVDTVNRKDVFAGQNDRAQSGGVPASSASTKSSGPLHAPAPLAQAVPELPEVANFECKPVRIDPQPAFALSSVSSSSPSSSSPSTSSPSWSGEEDAWPDSPPSSASSQPTLPYSSFVEFPSFHGSRTSVNEASATEQRLTELQATELPMAESMQRLQAAVGGTAEKNAASAAVLVEPTAEAFPCPPRVIHLDISLELSWKPKAFTQPLEVPLQPRLYLPEGELWRNREYPVGQLPVVVGDLARLRFPTAEVDDAESRRYRKTRAPRPVALAQGHQLAQGQPEDEAVPVGFAGSGFGSDGNYSRNSPTQGLPPRSGSGAAHFRSGSGSPGQGSPAGEPPSPSSDATNSAPPRAIQIAWPAGDRRAHAGDRRVGSGDRRQQPRRIPLEVKDPLRDSSGAHRPQAATRPVPANGNDTNGNDTNGNDTNGNDTNGRDTNGNGTNARVTTTKIEPVHQAVPGGYDLASQIAAAAIQPGGFPSETKAGKTKAEEPVATTESSPRENATRSPHAASAMNSAPPLNSSPGMNSASGMTGTAPVPPPDLAGEANGDAPTSDPNLYTAPLFTQLDSDKARPGSVLAKIKSLLGPVPVVLLVLHGLSHGPLHGMLHEGVHAAVPFSKSSARLPSGVESRASHMPSGATELPRSNPGVWGRDGLAREKAGD